MSKQFISVHSFNKDEEIIINKNLIVKIEIGCDSKRPLIELVDGSSVRTKDSMDEIKSKL